MKNISADASHHLLALTVSVANKTCFIYLQVESGYEALVEFYSAGWVVKVLSTGAGTSLTASGSERCVKKCVGFGK